MRWFLFETGLGDRLLAWLEGWLGLALVEVDRLGSTARVIGGSGEVGGMTR